MTSEPLRSAYSTLVQGDDTSLALPSDNKLRSGQQRVLDQVHTMKRSKSRYGSTGATSPTSVETKANGFSSFRFSPTMINGGTFSRSTASGSTLFSKGVIVHFAQQKNFTPSAGQQVNTITRRLISTSSHRDYGFAPTSPVSIYSPMKHSRSDPELPIVSSMPRIPNRSATINYRVNRNSSHFTNQGSQVPNNQPSPMRAPSFHSPQITSKRPISKGKTEQMGVNGDVMRADMTMRDAVEYLSNRDENFQHCGTSFIQHATFKDDKSKQEVFRLNGISGLIGLLRSSNPQIQQTASGALRNLVFKDQANKLEVKRCNGIPETVALLKATQNLETQKQLTGLLWNLSSAEELKPDLTKEVLPVLTEHVVVPFAASAEETPHLNSSLDPEVFYNATGCLRNLSSAQEADRQSMRKCRGLIDSLMVYVQASVDAGRPDDKSVENCVCILHNLTYQLESEVPSQFSSINALASMPTRDMDDKRASSVGCFSPQSNKISQKTNFNLPLSEEINPKGVGLLSHSKTMKTYLSLMESSKKDSTLEACAGALQNLTASKGIVSNVMSQTIVQKLNGLPQISQLLNSSNPSLQKTATSLLGNMSRTPGLQSSMAGTVLPKLTSLLSSGAKNGIESDDTMATACHTACNLMMSNPEMTKTVLNSGLLNSLGNLSKNSFLPKSSKAASVLLYNLWSDKDLQGFLKKVGIPPKYMTKALQ
ncbi:PKP1 protein, partial [Amia calva]|nr:PKP1 protein [Amia calva]